MDIDRFKEHWKQIELRNESLEEENRRLVERIKRGRFTGDVDRLKGITRRIMAVCVAGMVMGFIFAGDTAQAIMPGWLLTFYELFFVVMLGLQCYQYSLLSNIDYGQMSLREAMTSTCRYKVVRMRSKMVGYILCLPLCFCLIKTSYESGGRPALYGGIVGLVIGGLIGFFVDLRLRRTISAMISDLKANIDDVED